MNAQRRRTQQILIGDSFLHDGCHSPQCCYALALHGGLLGGGATALVTVGTTDGRSKVHRMGASVLLNPVTSSPRRRATAKAISRRLCTRTASSRRLNAVHTPLSPLFSRRTPYFDDASCVRFTRSPRRDHVLSFGAQARISQGSLPSPWTTTGTREIVPLPSSAAEPAAIVRAAPAAAAPVVAAL